jgi:(p)ppGpp synthase/HD superfamily hydrolase
MRAWITHLASGAADIPVEPVEALSKRSPVLAAPNPFVHAVYVSTLAFQDGRRDGSDELFLKHALDVAQALGPEATVAELSTAVLHDVLEDTDWTRDDLAEAGIDVTVMEAVETLTRRPAEEDERFVARICATPGEVGAIAKRVKLADLTVNRANAESDEERKRFERAIPVVQAAVERSAEREVSDGL